MYSNLIKALTACLFTILAKPTIGHDVPSGCQPNSILADPNNLCGYYDCDHADGVDLYVRCPRGYRVDTDLALAPKPINPCVIPYDYEAQNCLSHLYDDYLINGLVPADLNPCNPNPCENGGVCSRFSATSYRCTCPPPYSGPTCCNNECEPNPCINGGVCQYDGYRHFCVCPQPWIGSICQINSLCQGPRGPGVVCRQVDGAYQSMCDDCYIGTPESGCISDRSCQCLGCSSDIGVTCVENIIGGVMVGECRCAECYTGSPSIGCARTQSCECHSCSGSEGVECQMIGGLPTCVCGDCYTGNGAVCIREGTCACMGCPTDSEGVKCVDTVFGRGQCFCDACYRGTPQTGCTRVLSCDCLNCTGHGVTCVENASGVGQCVCSLCHVGDPYTTGCVDDLSCDCIQNCPRHLPGVTCVEDVPGIGRCTCEDCHTGSPSTACVRDLSCTCKRCPSGDGVTCRNLGPLGVCMCDSACYAGNPYIGSGCVARRSCDCMSPTCPTGSTGVRCTDDLLGVGRCYCDVCYTGDPYVGCTRRSSCQCRSCPDRPGVICVDEGEEGSCMCNSAGCYVGDPFSELGCSVDPDCACAPCLRLGGTQCTVNSVTGQAVCSCAACYRGDPYNGGCSRDMSCGCSDCPVGQAGVTCTDVRLGTGASAVNVAQCRCIGCYNGTPYGPGGCIADLSCSCISCPFERGLRCVEAGGRGRCVCRDCYTGDPTSGQCTEDRSCACTACPALAGVMCLERGGVGFCDCGTCYTGTPATGCTLDSSCVCADCRSRPGTTCQAIGTVAICTCQACYSGDPEVGCTRNPSCACLDQIACPTLSAGTVCVESPSTAVGVCQCNRAECYTGSPGQCTLDNDCLCADCRSQPNTVCVVSGGRAVCSCADCYYGDPATGCNRDTSCGCLTRLQCDISSPGTICTDMSARVGQCGCNNDMCYFGEPGSCAFDPICLCRDCLMRPNTRCGAPEGVAICECSACYTGNPNSVEGCSLIPSRECACSDCSLIANTDCSESGGVATCTCAPCYAGNPYNGGCSRINSCRCGDCPLGDVGVVCSDTASGPDCRCDASRCFEGDPRNGICRVNTECQCRDCLSIGNTLCSIVNGSPQCMCADCYSGDPYNGGCSRVSTCECLNGCDTTLSSVTCSTPGGQAVCACATCYQGNPFVGCALIVPPPLCECLPTRCPVELASVECGVENNVATCRCAECYTGNPYAPGGCTFDSDCQCRPCNSQPFTECIPSSVPGQQPVCNCIDCYVPSGPGSACIRDTSTCRCLSRAECDVDNPAYVCDDRSGRARCECANCYRRDARGICVPDRSCDCIEGCRVDLPGVQCTNDQDLVGTCACEPCFSGDPYASGPAGCQAVTTTCDCYTCRESFECRVTGGALSCACPNCTINNGQICIRNMWDCACNRCEDDSQECVSTTPLGPSPRICRQAPTQQIVGKSEFTFVFTDNNNTARFLNLDLELYVAAVQGDRTVRLTTPNYSPSDGECYIGPSSVPQRAIDQDIFVPQDTVARIDLPQRCFRHTGNGSFPGVLHLSEVNQEGVQVFGMNKELFTTDGFGLIGDSLAGTFYRAVCYVENVGTCQFAAVAFSPGITRLTFTLTDFAGDYDAGVEYIRNLARWTSYQVQSTTNDLTGSSIECDKPCNVFAGSFRTGLNGVSRDHLAGQLLDLTRYGTEYVVVPIPRDTSVYDHEIGPVVRIVPAERQPTTVLVTTYNATSQTVSSQTVTVGTTIDTDESLNQLGESGLAITTVHHLRVLSPPTARISVTHFVASGGRGDDHDPAMMVMPAAPSQWATKYLFRPPLTSGGQDRLPRPFRTNYALIVIQSSARSRLVIETTSNAGVESMRVDESNWSVVPGRAAGQPEWSAVAQSIGTGTVSVYHLDEVPFQCMFEGGDDRESYGLATYFNLS